MGPRLGRVEYLAGAFHRNRAVKRFNGATLRTRGIQTIVDDIHFVDLASMGPRLGRVEYFCGVFRRDRCGRRFNGATLRTRGIRD